MQKKLPMPSLFVADDDELFKRILKMNLARLPVFKHVLYFNTGFPLIKYLQENQNDSRNLPDVLFIDPGSPQSGGWEVLDFLQTLYPAFQKQVLVYVISVSIDPRNRERALRYDFVRDFFTKPLSRDQLQAVATEYKMMNF
jgi:CheY-like chemotaxis protein